MELPAWVERVMNPLRQPQLPVVDYNAICSAVMQLGEREGERLVQSIVSIRDRAAR